MAVSMIWGPPGSGKTVAATAPANEKILLLCSDNSDIVLDMFERKNVTRERVEHWIDPAGGDNCLAKQFEKAVSSGAYSLIVLDNLTDIKELALQEVEDAGKIRDIRQIYQVIYMALKRLAREAANAKCNVTFTAWSLSEEFVRSDGTKEMRQMPNLPNKIIDQILGLCNIVAYMTSGNNAAGVFNYYCKSRGSETLYGCKDQLFGRSTFMPRDIFKKPIKEEKQ